MNPCRAPRCDKQPPDGKPFCQRHWAMLPPRLKSRWHHRGTLSPADAERLLAEIAASVAAIEFGERLL